MIQAEPVTVRMIAKAVGTHFQVPPYEILAHRRNRDVVWPRHVTVGLAVRLTRFSLPMIGAALGGRDHTTILHARRRFEDRVSAEPAVAAEVETIEGNVAQLAARARLSGADYLDDELGNRARELVALERDIEIADRRFAAMRRSFEIVAAAKAVARARSAVIIAEHTPGQGAARRALDLALDDLMRVAEAGHV